MNKIKLTTLLELSMKLQVPKSKLQYYYHSGLLKTESVVGKVRLFDEKKTLARLKEIQKLSNKGLQIREIAKL